MDTYSQTQSQVWKHVTIDCKQLLCEIHNKRMDLVGEKVQKRFLLAEQGSPPQYCFKKVVIQKLSSTECSLEFVLTEEKKTELGLGEQYSERDYAG